MVHLITAHHIALYPGLIQQKLVSKGVALAYRLPVDQGAVCRVHLSGQSSVKIVLIVILTVYYNKVMQSDCLFQIGHVFLNLRHGIIYHYPEGIVIKTAEILWLDMD